MKYILISIVFFSGLTGFSFGGDCLNGFCNKPYKSIQSSPRVVVSPNSKVVKTKVQTDCANGKCNKSTKIK